MKSIFKGVLLLSFIACASCSSNSYSGEDPGISSSKQLSMVEKAWMARHHYDSERRLLVPKVGGARWGSTQEYNEDGTLTYLDWWVRDVKMEDLEASPSTFVEVIVDEEEAISSDARGSLDAQAPIQTNAVEDESIGTDIFSAPEAQTISADPFSVPEPVSDGNPESVDPFSPVEVPDTEAVQESPEPEVSPFAPLEIPF